MSINKEIIHDYNMTYEEKKSLYESIMKDVAKSVKRQLNENFYEYDFKKDSPEEYKKFAKLNTEANQKSLKQIEDISKKLIQKYPTKSTTILDNIFGILLSFASAKNEQDLVKKLKYLIDIIKKYNDFSMSVDFDYLNKHQ